MRCIVLLAVIASLLFTSCKTQKTVFNYLEDTRDSSIQNVGAEKDAIIQKNDLLSIQITSASLVPGVDELYNRGSLSSASGEGSNGGGTSGYLVDKGGNIEIPRVGVLHAEGLTKGELATAIKQKLNGVLADPSVVIRFLNFRVSVLGEVARPGVQTIPVESVNLLEALAMAGDITDFGKKTEVKVVRDHNGAKEIGVVDVTSSSMFRSPYFQLQKNDVVLVDQGPFKQMRTDQQRTTQK